MCASLPPLLPCARSPPAASAPPWPPWPQLSHAPRAYSSSLRSAGDRQPSSQRLQGGGVRKVWAGGPGPWLLLLLPAGAAASGLHIPSCHTAHAQAAHSIAQHSAPSPVKLCSGRNSGMQQASGMQPHQLWLPTWPGEAAGPPEGCPQGQTCPPAARQCCCCCCWQQAARMLCPVTAATLLVGAVRCPEARRAGRGGAAGQMVSLAAGGPRRAVTPLGL